MTSTNTKYIIVKLDQHQLTNDGPSNVLSKEQGRVHKIAMAKQQKIRQKEIKESGASENHHLILDVNEAVVHYTLNDTFSTLLEKCLSVFNIKGNESTTRSQRSGEGETKNDDMASRKSVSTKQALLYDSQMILVTMLREVQHGDCYTLEIVDDEILQFNSLSAPKMHKQNNSSSGGDQTSSTGNNNRGESFGGNSSSQMQLQQQ